MMHHYWGMHFFWWLFWLVMIGVFLFTILRSSPGERGKETHQEKDPLKVLQRQYAAGKYTTEEYHERKKILEQDT